VEGSACDPALSSSWADRGGKGKGTRGTSVNLKRKALVGGAFLLCLSLPSRRKRANRRRGFRACGGGEKKEKERF